MSGKKKSGANSATWSLSPGAKAFLIVGILALCSFALWIGGQVSLTPGKMVISGKNEKSSKPDKPEQPSIEQEAVASEEGSSAKNSLGNINQGTAGQSHASRHVVPERISQHARANGKNSEAMNAAGDINLK